MPSETRLSFGRIELLPGERVLRVDGAPAHLGARAFDLLLALAERRERVVTKQELLDLVWPGLVVEEHNIAAQISTLRKVLGTRAIVTVPGRGYRFVAPDDAPPAAGASTRLGTPGGARHNLPPQRTRFIGRDAQLGELRQLTAQSPLVTLTGIGGSGKTRLALECAGRLLDMFPAGVWFVDLAPLTAPERVAFACARVLGLADDAPELLLARLAAAVGDRQTLFVLDNCEHVRGAAAALADALLAGGSGARVLATSRVPLGSPGEQRYPVRPLSLPDSDTLDDVRDAEAPRMFAERARLMQPDFELDARNAADVAELCRRLDGVALAIELAAARVPLLSVTEISARLHDRFRLLVRSDAADPRQQTLATVVAWSYESLSADARSLLRALSAAAGSCTLVTAMALAGDTDEYAVLGRLTALHDRSLILVDVGEQPRYRLLDTVRHFARDRLGEEGETDVVLARHAAHFLSIVEAGATRLNGPQESHWLQQLHAERGHLAAAISWCSRDDSPADPTWAVRLVAATGRYWLFHEIELGCRLAEAALRRDADATAPEARFHTLRALAGMHMHRGQREAGLSYAHEALALARRAGRPEWEAPALNVVGVCLGHSDADESEKLRYLRMARDLAQVVGDASTLSSSLNNIATLDFRHRRLAEAEHGLQQGLRLARAQGNVRSALIYLNNLVRVLVAARNVEGARNFAVEAERLLRRVAEDVLKLELLEVSAGIASVCGDHARAARWWGFACRRFVEEGYRRPPEDEAQLQLLSAVSREALGATAFRAAEAAGHALALPDAMGELRQWLGSDSR